MATPRTRPYPAPPFRAPVHADVAQLVEQLIRNQQVAGSIPAVGSIIPGCYASRTASDRFLATRWQPLGSPPRLPSRPAARGAHSVSWQLALRDEATIRIGLAAHRSPRATRDLVEDFAAPAFASRRLPSEPKTQILRRAGTQPGRTRPARPLLDVSADGGTGHRARGLEHPWPQCADAPEVEAPRQRAEIRQARPRCPLRPSRA